MTTGAPIAVFVFRRPEHLRRTLTSLRQCRGFATSPVIVFGDGPRDDSERPAVEATRRVARELLGDRAEYVFSESNLGLAQSVIRGVSQTVSQFGRVIVLEDDLEVAPNFLAFMNSALDFYADNTQVYQISGYQFSVPEFGTRPSALFLPIVVSWGWATWKRAWEQFDPEASGWERLRHDGRLRHRFNLDGAYDYATMLVRQVIGLRDSWAIRWYWSVFQMKGLVLFPPVSLVRNTGFDGTGTHGRGVLKRFISSDTSKQFADVLLPEDVRIRSEDFFAAKRAVGRMNGGWYGRAVDRLRWYSTVLKAHVRARI